MTKWGGTGGPSLADNARAIGDCPSPLVSLHAAEYVPPFLNLLFDNLDGIGRI